MVKMKVIKIKQSYNDALHRLYLGGNILDTKLMGHWFAIFFILTLSCYYNGKDMIASFYWLLTWAA